MRRIAVASLVGALLLGITALAPAGASAARKGHAASGYTFGLLLPDIFVPRYNSQDYPYFKAEISKLCGGCKVDFQNAADDANTQVSQAQAMIASHVNVLVVDPVDGATAGVIVKDATAAHIPVISYDRLITSKNLSYVVSNNYYQVGVLQAKALVSKLKAEHVKSTGGKGIVMLNGADTDPNALNIKKAALSVIRKSGYKVLTSNDSWDPTTQNQFASAAITKYGSKIIAFYSANDGNAGAAIGALKGTENAINPWPVITGLDASIPGVQSILDGLQYMTTFNDFRKEATAAAKAAYTLAQGKKVTASAHIEGAPEFLNQPQAVTQSNANRLLVKSGFYKASQICTSQYMSVCKAAGIKVK